MIQIARRDRSRRGWRAHRGLTMGYEVDPPEALSDEHGLIREFMDDVEKCPILTHVG
jgi:hypothetical protein